MQEIMTEITSITEAMATTAITRTAGPMATTGISARITATLATTEIITTAGLTGITEISATPAMTARVPVLLQTSLQQGEMNKPIPGLSTTRGRLLRRLSRYRGLPQLETAIVQYRPAQTRTGLSTLPRGVRHHRAAVQV